MKSQIFSIIPLAFLAAAHTRDAVEVRWAICEDDPKAVIQKLHRGDIEKKIKNPDRVDAMTHYYPQRVQNSGLQLILYNKTRDDGEQISVAKILMNLPFPGQLIGGLGDEHKENLEMILPPEHSSEHSPICFWEWYNDDAFYTCELESHRGRKPKESWSQDQKDFMNRWYGGYKDFGWDSMGHFGPHPLTQWKLKVGDHKVVLSDWETETTHAIQVKFEASKKSLFDTWGEVNDVMVHKGVNLCDSNVYNRAKEVRSWPYVKNLPENFADQGASQKGATS